MTAPAPAQASEKDWRHSPRAQAILDAAIELIREQGYAALTIKKVADSAGVGVGNLMHYFPTKRILMCSVIDKLSADYTELWDRKGFHTFAATARDQLDHYLQFYFAILTNRGLNLLAWDIWAMSGRNEDMLLARRQFEEHINAKLARLLQAVNPKLTRERAEELALIIHAMMNGLSLYMGKDKPMSRAARASRKRIKEDILYLIER